MATLLKRAYLISAGAWAAGFVIIASAALTGCGPVRAGGAISGAPASGAHAGRSDNGSSKAAPSRGRAASAPIRVASVCAAPAAVTSVRVTRLPTLTQLGQAKSLPRQLPGIDVRDPGKARALARLVCGLPRMPKGIISCPVDIGGGYQLAFVAGRRHLPAVTVRASGCETVTGAGPGGARWVAGTHRFWARLSRLTGIQAAAHTP